MKNNELISHLFCILCVIVWGTTFIVSKNLLEVLSPAALMWLRFVVAYLALWALHPHWHFHWREEPQFLLISLFGNTLYFIAENTALALTQTSNVSILVATAPILTALFLWIFKHEKLSLRQIFGFAVAFAGVILVVLNGVLFLRLKPLGDLMALAAAALWAVYGILVRRCSEKYNSFLLTRKLMFYGILTSTPLLLLQGEQIDFGALLTVRNVGGLLFLGLIGSAACYVLWNSAIRRLGALKTSLYLYAIPLVTLLAGAMLLNEKVTPMGVGGIVLVIAGMVMSNLKGKRQTVKKS